MYAGVYVIVLFIATILLGIVVYEMFKFLQEQKKQNKELEKISEQNKLLKKELEEIEKILESKSDDIDIPDIRD